MVNKGERKRLQRILLMGFKFDFGQLFFFYTVRGKKLEAALVAVTLSNYNLSAALIIHHSDCCGLVIRA